MRLEDGVFIITGGGSGLGEGAARVFVEAGAQIILADMDTANGERVASELGSRARFVKCNVAQESDVQACVDAALAACGSLHGAVNCAGIGAAQRVLGKDGPHPLDGFRRVIDVNLTGTFNVMRLCAAAMAKLPANDRGERGVFINTASVAAFDGQIGQAAYSASKGGVVGMTLPVARELGRFGIRVVAVAPGLFDTPMLAAVPAEVRHSLGAQIPFPSRLGEPREFGMLARHIVENEMINGDVIRLDGALRMPPK